MKKFFLLSVMLFITFLLFIILKTDFPTIPSLDQNIKICKREDIFGWKVLKLQNETVISCRDSISLDTLYKTQSLEVKLKTNQQFKMRATLRYKGSEIISTDTLEVKPETDSSYVLSFLLDRPTVPKLNRLVSDIDEIIFHITDLSDSKELKLSIDDVSLN